MPSQNDKNTGLALGGDFVALTGALMDVYSLDILHEAQGIMKFENFATRRLNLNAAPGETVKFTVYEDIFKGGELDEATPLTSKSMVASQKDLVIKEYGNAIKVSEKMMRLSWQDIMSESATLLGRDYSVVRDIELRDALLDGATNVHFVDSVTAGGNGLRNLITDIAAADIMTTDAVRRAAEVLETNNTPKFNGDYYVCFIHPHQASALRTDTKWVSAHTYNKTEDIYNGEIGRWEDVIFVTTSHMNNGAAGATNPGFDATLKTGHAHNAVPLTRDLYKSIMFGDQALYCADALPVELRDNGVEDFGRTRGLAWYAMWGCASFQPNYSCVMITA